MRVGFYFFSAQRGRSHYIRAVASSSKISSISVICASPLGIIVTYVAIASYIQNHLVQLALGCRLSITIEIAI